MRIIIATCICLSFLRAEAQTNKGQFELSAGIGAWSTDYLFDGYTPGILSDPKKDYTNYQYSGAYFFNARYFVMQRLSINLTVAYESESGDWQASYNYDHFGAHQTVLLGTFSRRAYTVSPELSIYYSDKKSIRTYGTVALGLTFRQETDKYSQDYITGGSFNTFDINSNYPQGSNNKVQGNMYFSPLGISIGNKICWAGEIGLGYKGILNTSIIVKL